LVIISQTAISKFENKIIVKSTVEDTLLKGNLPNLFEEYKEQGFVRGQIIKRKING
jgi:hypothetical protein